MSSIVTFNIQYDPAVIYEGDIDLNDTLAITALTDNCNIYLKRNNTSYRPSFNDRPINIVYSLDEGETWIELNLESQEYSYEVNLGTLISGKSIYIRGNNIGRSTLYGLNICTDKSASVSGKIMSLFYRKNPSNTLPQYNNYGAFQGIFSGSKITDASQLSLPTTLEYYCYAYMFDICTSLTSVPVLSATTLAYGCYQGMFEGCTSLVNAPELASTSLAGGCYKGMFEGCTSITTAPVLPATTLKEYCYEGMFKGCTSITTAPVLPATRLVNGCYANMFENCTSLNYIHIYSEMQIGSPYTTNWVKNVAPSGTFVGTSTIEYTEIGVNGIPTTWYYQIAYDKKYFTIESLTDNNEIYCIINNSSSWTSEISLYYSLDNGATWTKILETTDQSNPVSIVTINTGDTVIFKGNNDTLGYYEIIGHQGSNITTRARATVFNASNNFKVYGNIMSLLNGDDFRTNSSFASGSSYNFFALFDSILVESTYIDNKLIDASNLVLPATTLTEGCYREMFHRCKSLTTAPSILPATTLAEDCYYWMFASCYSLTTAPELPATTLAEDCYYGMFDNCTSLTTAPSVLPATTLANYCYASMFRYCTSLTTAPELPATTLADYCYSGMFNNCTSLTTAPELPATTLADYCYTQMFIECTSLATAPSILPATTLAQNCCYEMFYGCTSLTKAPELPATTLADNCYRGMFSGCTKLNYVKCLATDISASKCLNYWLYNVASSGTFVKAASMSNWRRGTSGIPTGWTVQNA